MAKKVDTEAQCRKIVQDAKSGIFAPVYLLMGEEPYYPDIALEGIVRYALADSERDFNQSVYYGPDSDAGMVSSDARSYPMMSERRLVVLKEAQNMKDLEDLAVYAAEPLESTVLVIELHGKSVDKRKALYKTVLKNGTVLESPALRDYEMPGWIASYYRSRGLSIAPDAAALLAEYAGTDLCKITVETDKMLKNLPEGTTAVTASDIEKNVGISRQFNVFELTKELSAGRKPNALKIAAYIADTQNFKLVDVIPALFSHFYRILKLGAALMKNPGMSRAEAAGFIGANPYFIDEYFLAVRNYPVGRCMRVIALLEDYDFKGKGGGSRESGAGELFLELVSRIAN